LKAQIRLPISDYQNSHKHTSISTVNTSIQFENTVYRLRYVMLCYYAYDIRRHDSKQLISLNSKQSVHFHDVGAG